MPVWSAKRFHQLILDGDVARASGFLSTSGFAIEDRGEDLAIVSDFSSDVYSKGAFGDSRLVIASPSVGDLVLGKRAFSLIMPEDPDDPFSGLPLEFESIRTRIVHSQ